MASPFNPQFSSDSTSLCYLKPVNGVSELYTIVLNTGQILPVFTPNEGGDTEINLSIEEKLRRERTRQLSTGVTSFHWIPHSQEVIFPQQGNLYVTNIEKVIQTSTTTTTDTSGTVTNPAPIITSSPPSAQLLYDRTITGDTKGSIIDPKPSPNGKYLAFVQDNELYVTVLNNRHTTTNNTNTSLLNPATRITYGA